MQPGAQAAGISRVSKPLQMKKISDGGSTFLYCSGSHNKIPHVEAGIEILSFESRITLAGGVIGWAGS